MQYRLSIYEEGVWDVYWYEKNLLGNDASVFTFSATGKGLYASVSWTETSLVSVDAGAELTLSGHIVSGGHVHTSWSLAEFFIYLFE